MSAIPVAAPRTLTYARARLFLGTSAVGPVWHVARVALYTSGAGMGFLGRAVHCNLGRPEVWVFLPSD